MIGPPVVKVALVQGIVRFERVGLHYTVGPNLFLDHRQERLGFCVGDDSRVDLSTLFLKAKHRYFARSASSNPAFAHPAKIALIRLNFPREFIAGQLGSNELAKPLKEDSNGVPVDAGDLDCGPSCDSCNKHFYQLCSLLSS